MKVTFYGQSYLNIAPAGPRLLFDPFVRPDELAKNVEMDATRADDLFSTHGHSEPVADAVDLAGRTATSVIAQGQVGLRPVS